MVITADGERPKVGGFLLQNLFGQVSCFHQFTRKPQFDREKPLRTAFGVTRSLSAQRADAPANIAVL